MASVAKFDRWEGTDGVVKGTVLQVQTYTTKDYLAQSFTANTREAVVGCSVSITPSATTNKILIMVNWMGEQSVNNSWNQMFGLMKNGVELGIPNDLGVTYAGNYGIMPPSLSYYTADVNSTTDSVCFHYVDTAGSTNPITYSLSFGADHALTLKTGGAYNWNTARTTGYERGICVITAMEIQA